MSTFYEDLGWNKAVFLLSVLPFVARFSFKCLVIIPFRDASKQCGSHGNYEHAVSCRMSNFHVCMLKGKLVKRRMMKTRWHLGSSVFLKAPNPFHSSDCELTSSASLVSGISWSPGCFFARSLTVENWCHSSCFCQVGKTFSLFSHNFNSPTLPCTGSTVSLQEHPRLTSSVHDTTPPLLPPGPSLLCGHSARSVLTLQGLLRLDSSLSWYLSGEVIFSPQSEL